MKNPQHKNKQKRSTAGGLFRRVWTPEETIYYTFGLPVLRKNKSPEAETVRFIGLPITKTYIQNLEQKTFLFGIPVGTRINHRYFEQSVFHLLDRLNSLPIQTTSANNEYAALTDRLHALPAFQLMCQARDRKLKLEDEVKIVTAEVVQKMKTRNPI